MDFGPGPPSIQRLFLESLRAEVAMPPRCTASSGIFPCLSNFCRSNGCGEPFKPLHFLAQACDANLVESGCYVKR